MDRNAVLSRIRELGVVPVVRAQSGDEALALIEALRLGGIDVIELTMTVPGAVEIIRELSKKKHDFVLGAGTVLDPETARACMLAGAQFIVSPATDEATITCCRTYGVPIMSGALTPTEVVKAWKAGADMVKVFPCGAVGGASYLKALKAPLPQIELIPTGGVSLESAGEFIKAGASAVGAGADLVDVKKLRAGEPQAITERARRYLAEVAKARA
ncbi:MAG TPA: bifunctional 4-hydroxy-2-oxoglutarate aldolase/2-dehydro-3-deoxy-phosphogluconate aldolase [Myxococcales bacterium]|jgi:2-dehydro-3-deoxyphosphogluconate aldolase/(4S)-4-hydroxy-2-oxoglutarate aldolase|nr:bifunctional 4-hydroxy-2-oxoglutarate aldolase/2-dehydro-3-deoxy-phosphogluconate aldolase [Myxococcales bacterium]